LARSVVRKERNSMALQGLALATLATAPPSCSHGDRTRLSPWSRQSRKTVTPTARANAIGAYRSWRAEGLVVGAVPAGAAADVRHRHRDPVGRGGDYPRPHLRGRHQMDGHRSSSGGGTRTPDTRIMIPLL